MGNFEDGASLCVNCDAKLSIKEVYNYGNECEPCFTGVSSDDSGDTLHLEVDGDLGIKFDDGKSRYSLVPADAMSQFVDVLTFGAKKYGDHNWRQVPNLQNRYYDALQRHLVAFRAGDALDDESGLHHLAHAMCCLSFMMQDDIAGRE